MKSFIITLLAAITFCLPSLSAEKKSNNKVLTDSTVAVTRHQLYQTDDNKIYLDMEILLKKDFKVSSNRMTHLVPMFQAADSTRTHEYAPVVVYGRKREIIHRRNKILPTDAYRIMRRENGEEQRIEYSALIPYEEWMKEGCMKLWVDLCGCADCQQEELFIPIGRLIPPFNPVDYTSFTTPKTTGPKIFALNGQAYIDFRLDSINLDPIYRKNPDELKRIYESIESVRGGDNKGITHIDSINIKGYASPEGKYAHNEYLAENRARTLANYVKHEYALEKVPFSVTYEPEDWEGLRKRIAEGNYADKERILAIIDDPTIKHPDARNNKLKTLAIYKELLDNVYPALRHSDYTIFYTVRGFNDDEVVEIYRTRPWMLDQNELYRVALTMQPGTDEYNELFMQAVRRFPNDSTANLNAAAIALQIKDLKRAKSYLDKAGQSPEADCNRAVYLYLNGEQEQAYQLFDKAAQNGCQQAQAALQELNRRKELKKE